MITIKMIDNYRIIVKYCIKYAQNIEKLLAPKKQALGIQ